MSVPCSMCPKRAISLITSAVLSVTFLIFGFLPLVVMVYPDEPSSYM